MASSLRRHEVERQGHQLVPRYQRQGLCEVEDCGQAAVHQLDHGSFCDEHAEPGDFDPYRG